MSDPTNILICGVGGQGTILASRVLSGIAIRRGFQVKVSEIHGMAQRGGSVLTQVRFGPEVFSPIIPQGQADIILAFEKLEALRWLPYLREKGTIIINDQKMDPLSVITGAAEYPKNIENLIRSRRSHVLMVNALAIARHVGNLKVTNMVLLGLLSGSFDTDLKIWLEVISQTVPPKFLKENMKAFQAGRQEYRKILIISAHEHVSNLR